MRSSSNSTEIRNDARTTIARARILDIINRRPTARSKSVHDRFLEHRGMSETAIAAHWDRWHPPT